MTAAGGAGRRAALGGWLLLALLGLYTALVHAGLGPRPRVAAGEGPWWAPSGFLLEALARSALAPAVEGPRLGAVAFALPALALAVGVWVLTRSALARTLAVAGVLAVALFAFYGLGERARLVWRFFDWRGSATMLGLAGLVAALGLAPAWLQRARRLGAGLGLAAYVPVALALLALQRDVTGTDPTLPFAVSPWPVLPIFGLGVAGALLAALQLGIGVGLLGLAEPRWAPRLALPTLGIALAAGAVVAGSASGLLPFRASGATLAGFAGAAALGMAAAAAFARGGGPRRRRGAEFVLAALAIGVPLTAGRLLERADYHETRHGRAERVVAALETWYAREGLYPDDLAELVAAGDLAVVPRPRIGFGWPGGNAFTYQNFGTSYLLEFAAPRWVQCAYNPPYRDEPAEETAPDLAAGSWSCPAQPPELW